MENLRYKSTLVELAPNVIDRFLTANFPGIIRWVSAVNETEWVCFGETSRFLFAAEAQTALASLPETAVTPRCFGALPFDHRKWNELPAWVMPQLTITKLGSEWIGLVIQSQTDNQSTQTIIDHYLNRIDGKKPEQEFDAGFSSLIELSATYDRWKWLIHNLQTEIAERRLRKAVLSRREIWRLPNPLHFSSLFDTMRRRSPHCYRFLFPAGAEVLIGASPERLFSIRNGRITVDALAGTRRRGTTEAEDRILAEELLNSEKDREEQRIVVETLTQNLQQLCSSCSVVPDPTIKKTNHVQHLYTELQGELRNDISVDEILHLLHPTPATGGDPKEDALAFLARYESHSRLYFAGPVGWVDRENAEFAVAIRSAILYETYAALYAGVGVVAGSNASSEWYETTLKLQPMWNLLFGGVR